MSVDGESESMNKSSSNLAQPEEFSDNNGSPCGGTSREQINEMINSDSKAPLKTPSKEVVDTDTQVKFMINDSAKGRGKCIAENVIPSFSGLSKEELLKYANDPFWIRMRMLLFVFFWMVWLAMFVGAISIIVMAPKCEAPKKPVWYQQGPLYEVDVAQFVDVQGSETVMEDLKSKLDYLSDLKVKGVILSPVFKTDGTKEGNVVDFKSLDDKYGSLETFKELLKTATERDINVILSFTPNHSSNKHVWFNKSIAGELPYSNYYVWAPPSGIASNGSKLPPNNWLSVTGGSAWEWVEKRQEFYLHQFGIDQPDLNFHNPDVLEEFNEILLYWLGMGAKGFNLDKVQYLLEDEELQNENPNGKPGAVHTQYEFYSHTKTHNLPGVANILASWRSLIKKETDEKGILIVTGDVPVPTDSNSTTISVDISRSEKLLKNLPKNFTANDLYNHLQHIIKSGVEWPPVQLGDRYMKRVSDMFGEENVDGLNMITLLLPATPIVYFGEELGLSGATPFSWRDDETGVSHQKSAQQSHYKVFEALINARDTQTALYGNTNLKVLNDTVLVLTRINLGNPGFLVAYNPSNNNITVDLSTIDYVPGDLMLHTKSVNNSLTPTTGHDKIKSDRVNMEPKSAVMFTFAPKIEE
ncbi:hypothetical protein RUM43_004207 [Polyplax serrata]|uniref:alpha-glucosidase n=1 Tax=Polyplax serrata TaxID=468196 RepID=A0AAN8SAM8_POLSC